jgi:hypothetical protein
MSCRFSFLLATSYALFGEKQGTLHQLTTADAQGTEGEVELPSGWTRAIGKLNGAPGFRSPSGKWQSLNPLANGSISEKEQQELLAVLGVLDKGEKKRGSNLRKKQLRHALANCDSVEQRKEMLAVLGKMDSEAQAALLKLLGSSSKEEQQEMLAVLGKLDEGARAKLMQEVGANVGFPVPEQIASITSYSPSKSAAAEQAVQRELPSGWTRTLGKLNGAPGFRGPSGKWQPESDQYQQAVAQALAQAQPLRKLVVKGLANDRYQIMGEYELMEGEVVNGRAVWQKQGGDDERLLYAAGSELGGSRGWIVSTKEHMHASSHIYLMKLLSAAFTPDRKLSSEVWEVLDGRQFASKPEVRLAVWEVHDVGCFHDERFGSKDELGHMWERPEGDGLVTVVTQQISGGLTPAKCAATCWSKSFSYMGLQNGNDCWCGEAYNSEAEVDQYRCSTACLGDKTSICGGFGVNSVHLISLPNAAFGKRLGQSSMPSLRYAPY